LLPCPVFPPVFCPPLRHSHPPKLGITASQSRSLGWDLHRRRARYPHPPCC
jgi:hypothetical protein